MPIETACPHCGKKYRLKDELAGKRATCSNGECRRTFLVPNPQLAAAKARENESLMEAEALAASLFGDEGIAGPIGEVAQVDVVCAMCDHKWSEPGNKIGKIVLCPECKHRQKIPERKVKKADWRDPHADRPGAARGPELPDDLKLQRTTQVQFESMKQAGAIADDVEPIALATKLKWVFLAAALIIAIVVGGVLYFRNRTDGKENQFMIEALKEVPEYRDDGPMPKGQAALARALLMMSAGEYSARSGDKDKLKEALGQFGAARDELSKAPKSAERDLLIGELALALLSLGGNEDEVQREVKIRWSAQEFQAERTRIGPDLGNVQIEMRRVLSILRNDSRADDLDLRLSMVRRLARELSKLGKPDLLQEILTQAFGDGEYAEACAQVALAALEAGAPAEKIQPTAELLKTTVLGGNFNPVPISAQILWQKLGMAGTPQLVGNPGPTEMSRAVRLHAVGLQLSQKNSAEALALANRPGQLDDRVLALAMIAELSSDPAPAIESLLETASRERAGFNKTTPQYALLRISNAAAKLGQTDKSDAVAALLADDGVRSWAKADALRWKLAANPKQKADNAAVDKSDAGNFRIGNALTALTVARHNAAETGDRTAAKEYETWGKGSLRGFGLAGLALGLQDNKR